MSATLTPKQAQFVREYLVDLNATQAAIRAGYSVRTAASISQDGLGLWSVSQERHTSRRWMGVTVG